jgi:hypothetical protein
MIFVVRKQKRDIVRNFESSFAFGTLFTDGRASIMLVAERGR